jgi:hypothetical protein
MDDFFIKWVEEIKQKTPLFLLRMGSSRRSGFFRYSYSGDYFGENIKWGLGNSVFALKIYYTLGLIPENLDDIGRFILSFQKKDGSFSDPLINMASLPLKLLNSMKTRNICSLSNKEVTRAQTRQAISVLHLFGLARNVKAYGDFPKTKNQIEEFLNSLNWNLPWGAGSHFSHLLFFLSFSDLRNKLELMEFAIKWINKLQKDDGSWYLGDITTVQQKINGAMKIITGFKVASAVGRWNNGKIYFSKADKLIDLCLSAENNSQACDNFNIVYVLKYCDEVLRGGYKRDEIEKFMMRKLDDYRNFYHEEIGAFSFFEKKVNRFYYGGLISKGKNEPDIHGTVLFLWGLAVMAGFLKLDKELKIREFIT